MVNDVFLDTVFDDWNYRKTSMPGYHEECCLEISPDARMKENVSGGAGYEMSLNKRSVDALLRNEPHHVNFIDYLRIAFWWGGLPGVEYIPDFPISFIEELRKDLLPI